MRTAPWTDGSGNQEHYARIVQQWCWCNEELPESSSHKILEDLRSSLLEAELYGGPIDICRGVTEDQITFKEAHINIANAIDQNDPLTVFNELFIWIFGIDLL